MTDRKLTEAQHSALDRIGTQYPLAEVIGWHKKDSEERFGPIIRFDERTTKFVNHSGRLLNG